MPRVTGDTSDTSRAAAWVTRNPLVAAAVLAGLFGGGGYASYSSILEEVRKNSTETREKFDQFALTTHDEIRDVQEGIRTLSDEVSRQNGDGWKRTEMRVWALQMQDAMNKAGVQVVVPSVP